MSTIAAALAAARETIPIVEARLLLSWLLGRNRAWLEAHRDDALEAAQEKEFAALAARRAAGEPIAYIVGRREFYGREFEVTPAVLIPRPETELLVETALAKVRAAAPRILDLGAGSGCVAVTLALETKGQVTAVDLSADALAVARGNAARLGAAVSFLQSDWFAAVTGPFDLIVGNPPYIAEGDAHLAAGDLRFEPALALACGPDGLAAIRRIVADAPRCLAPGGWLLFEHGYDQAEAVRALLEAGGFRDVEQHRDLAGIVRVSGGRLP